VCIFLFDKGGGGPGGVFGSTSPNEVNIFSLHCVSRIALQVVFIFVSPDFVMLFFSILRGCKI
jgi:hypothetical protein